MSIRIAPATDKAGVISGWIGKPSIWVVFVVVMFNEPLGIGVAVTMGVLTEDAGPLFAVGVAEALSLPGADEVLTSVALTKVIGLAEPPAEETSLDEFGGS